MTLSEVRRIGNHWKRQPPLRVLVAGCAAALGVKLTPEEDRERKYMNADEFARVAAAYGNSPKMRGAGPRR
jgi:hypothetical protein